MWDRAILKTNAKIALSGRYWLAFAVCIVAGLLSSVFSILIGFFGDRNDDSMVLPAFFGGLLFTAFVGMPVLIGVCRFFLHNHFGAADFGTLFSGFQFDYINVVGAMFTTNLFNFLWFFLLIIPGIIKKYEYSMVPFLLADNPSLTGKRARQISRMLTQGEKWNIFVLELSFIGWEYLGILCLLVGILFVIPYFNATLTELYIYLRDRAIQANMLNPAELGLVQPAAENPPVMSC